MRPPFPAPSIRYRVSRLAFGTEERRERISAGLWIWLAWVACRGTALTMNHRHHHAPENGIGNRDSGLGKCLRAFIRGAFLEESRRILRLRGSQCRFRFPTQLNLSDKPLASLGDGLYVFMLAAIVVQGFPEDRNGRGKIAFLHE